MTLLRSMMTRCLPILLLASLSGCIAEGPRAQIHVSRGDTALSRNDLQAALAEFREAVKLDPLLADAHTKLGLTYKATGELEKAADSLESAVRLDPQNFKSTFELGEVYRMLNRFSQAVRAYVLACRLQPENFDSHYRLASCYHQAGEQDQAIEAYNQALRINPRSAQAWSNLGALQDMKGKPYEAIQSYKRSLECDTDQPGVLVNLATVYVNQERFDAAQRALESAIRMAPNLSAAHERLGYCLWRENKLDDATVAYRKSIAADAHNARAQAGLGVVLMTRYLSSQGQAALREEAIEAWHESLELDANQPKLRELVEKYRVRKDKPTLDID